MLESHFHEDLDPDANHAGGKIVPSNDFREVLSGHGSGISRVWHGDEEPHADFITRFTGLEKVKSGEIEVVGTDIAEPFLTEDLLKEETDILLLSSRGNRNEDLTAVRTVRMAAPQVQILLIGVTGEEAEFLQCVRAGVRGYLPREW